MVLLMTILGMTWNTWGESRDLAPIGRHHPVFVVEKNENPQNIMVAFVKLGKDCRLAPDPERPGLPLFDFYWLMDGKRYKRVHPLIKAGVRSRMEIVSSAKNGRSFEMRLNDFKELRGDFAGARLTVSVEGAPCQPVTELALNAATPPIRLISIYSDSRKTFLPPFRKLNFIRLKGLTQGEPREMKFLAR